MVAKKTKKPIKKVVHKSAPKSVKTVEAPKDQQIYYCPICNSTFVHKAHGPKDNNANSLSEQFHFVCNHCGHKDSVFPSIEASHIHDLKPVKPLNEVRLPDGTKPAHYDPFKFILSLAIGIILIIFGVYISYLSLSILSVVYTVLLVIGGIFLIMGAIKNRNQHGTKK